MILPYSGVTNINLLSPLIKQVKSVSDAAVIVHRDRDFLKDEEVEEWKKQIRSTGALPFVTTEIDIEGYFSTKDYLSFSTKTKKIDVSELVEKALEEQDDAIISSYVNGRIDHERKSGTIGKLDIGKLSAAAAKKVAEDPWSYMKGKRKLARVRYVCQQIFGVKFEIDFDANLPSDQELSQIAAKYFKPTKAK